MDSEKFVDMLNVAMRTFEKDDPNTILVDFCLVCGLHEDCNIPSCTMSHCRGFQVLCDKDNCCCDRQILTQCQYTDIFNGAKRRNGKHIQLLSPGIAMWCKKCHTHLDCGFLECAHDHCVC